MACWSKNDVPVLIEAAKIVCGYCGHRNWMSDAMRAEFKQRPSKADEAGNYLHGGGTYCKAYGLWQKIEELECQAGQ